MRLTPCGCRIDHVLVLGYGVTGRAVVRFASSRGWAVRLSEQRDLPDEDRSELDRLGVQYELGDPAGSILKGVDAVIPSPGVPMSHPLLEDALGGGVPILSELDVAASACPPPIVAVTGTNGKSTVVTLISAILDWGGCHAPAVGNIGDPFIGIVDELADTCAVVVEVSSYQLEQSRCFRPRVGVLHNLTPDHLERHGSFEAYADAKGRLFRHQTAEDIAILPRDLAERFDQGGAQRVFLDEPHVALPSWAGKLAPHNRLNLRAALMAVHHVPGVGSLEALPFDAVRDAFRLPFRMEAVGWISSVFVVNDSKSTNADSSRVAIESMTGSTVLMLGGRFKGGGYDVLEDVLRQGRIRYVVLFGEAGSRLAPIVERSGVAHQRAARMIEAIDVALHEAQPGDVLLFSPGCSSFDEFTDYGDRGREFNRIIHAHPAFAAKPPNKDARPSSPGHMSAAE